MEEIVPKELVEIIEVFFFATPPSDSSAMRY